MSFFTLLTAGLAALAPLVSAYTTPVGDSPSGNAFSAPGSGTTVQAGQDFTVQWNPSTAGTVTLLLLKGENGQSLSVLYPIAEKIDNTGSYTWHVASDLTSGPTSTTGYGIQLIVDSNGQYQYTTPFGVAGSSVSASSSSSSGSTPTPRVGPPVAATRSATSTTASSDSSMQTSGSDTSSTDAVVASVYSDATSTGIVLVTPTTAASAAAAASTTLATSVSMKATTTTRAASVTSSTAAATNTGAASNVQASFMGLAAAAGLAILAF